MQNKIETLARSIQSNAEVVAMNPNDWPQNIQQRLDAISRDLRDLQNAVRNTEPGNR